MCERSARSQSEKEVTPHSIQELFKVTWRIDYYATEVTEDTENRIPLERAGGFLCVLCDLCGKINLRVLCS